MQIDVLGPVRVRRDGVEIDLGTPRQRAIVAALALEQGRVLSVPGLIARVWGDHPPASVQGTLQSYVGHLRRALEPDRGPRQPARVLITEHSGYALRIDRPHRDDAVLADTVAQARELLAVVPDPLRPSAPSAAREPIEHALAAVDLALAAWRGVPYADLDDDPDTRAERARLEDHRATAEELRVVAHLALGRHDEIASALEAMTRAHPLHERWWTLWAVALARSGRQADALAALQRLHAVLDEELGVEPSAPVRELQTAILRQDPSVTWQPTAAPATPSAGPDPWLWQRVLDPLRTPAAPAAPAGTADPREGVGDTAGDGPTAALRVAVVDDHPVFRMGMTGLLGSLDGLELVGAAGDPPGAHELVARGVDVVLMDLDLAGDSGIELTRALLATHPDLKVLVMTMHEDDDYVTGALQAGAAGYLLKSAEAGDVLRAIRGVARGELIIGAAVAHAARSRLAAPVDPR
ncbi:BTAD domain-containing putative transcriptional regulator [Nocardioides nitrophenolicus]|uniref:BTAD domain-containing putative transcriptional regulator n=1 Tax=Nocardioides nitrophenolicus TaxID=60489 RepID=UPI00195E5741|nr:BTAD domain-containing putative transcriptional regulator [Nocardioides nitrophenolicus]MBM7517037.1 DNA-binding SARP family transcriptional activator/ActR/RegA family two-component response regulator [Nocardioides nitrophenolicus]